MKYVVAGKQNEVIAVAKKMLELGCDICVVPSSGEGRFLHGLGSLSNFMKKSND